MEPSMPKISHQLGNDFEGGEGGFTRRKAVHHDEFKVVSKSINEDIKVIGAIKAHKDGSYSVSSGSISELNGRIYKDLSRASDSLGTFKPEQREVLKEILERLQEGMYSIVLDKSFINKIKSKDEFPKDVDRALTNMVHNMELVLIPLLEELSGKSQPKPPSSEIRGARPRPPPKAPPPKAAPPPPVKAPPPKAPPKAPPRDAPKLSVRERARNFEGQGQYTNPVERHNQQQRDKQGK